MTYAVSELKDTLLLPISNAAVLQKISAGQRLRIGLRLRSTNTALGVSGASSAEFAEIAKLAASVDTLEGFLREMKQRFPDATARAPASPQAKDESDHTGSLPTIPVVRQIKMTR